MVYYVAPRIIFSVLEPPYIIYRNPTCKGLSNNNINIAAREHPRAGSKQMATYQAVVAQTQSSSSIKFVLLSCHTNLVCSSRRLLAPTHYPLCTINECCVVHTYTA